MMNRFPLLTYILKMYGEDYNSNHGQTCIDSSGPVKNKLLWKTFHQHAKLHENSKSFCSAPAIYKI